MLGAAAQGHGERDGVVGLQAEQRRRAGRGERAEGLAAEAGDERRGPAAREQAVLEEDVGGAEADERGGAQGGRAFEAAVGVVAGDDVGLGALGHG